MMTLGLLWLCAAGAKITGGAAEHQWSVVGADFSEGVGGRADSFLVSSARAQQAQQPIGFGVPTSPPTQEKKS
jgi:hypothetical protein